MNLQDRIQLLVRLGQYILSHDPAWREAKERAGQENSWFIPEFIERAASSIAHSFLQEEALEKWVEEYELPPINANPKKVGIVMAGNIPLVGFHDLLCVFISGHRAIIKPSSRDKVLIEHLAAKMAEWNPEVNELVQFQTMLKNCDAYIATGSNNSAGYFDYYFNKYPHIIRRNRTSVAILEGNETAAELEKLADDVYLYFGRGCRNVTKIYVPGDYDFRALLKSFEKYNYLAENHKCRNNYDYNLAIHLLNKKVYMSNASLLLVEEPSLFSPISQLHYEYYETRDALVSVLERNETVQCIAGHGFVPFGQTQQPGISDYADGVDTLKFNTNL